MAFVKVKAANVEMSVTANVDWNRAAPVRSSVEDILTPPTNAEVEDTLSVFAETRSEKIPAVELVRTVTITVSALSVPTLKDVPVALVNESPTTVALATVIRVELMPFTLNSCRPVHTGVIDWERAGAPSERVNVLAVPFTAVSPTLAEGLAPVEEETRSPFIEIVPELLTLVPTLVSVEVPESPPVVFAQKTKLSTEIAEEEDSAPLPARDEDVTKM